MKECVFCEIISDTMPSHKVCEDSGFIAFLDTYPRVKGHTLVIPRKHYRWVYDVPDFAGMWDFALAVTKAINEALKPEFVTYLTHGLEVPHAHIHILPRRNEREFMPGKVLKMSDAELGSVAAEIRLNLKK